MTKRQFYREVRKMLINTIMNLCKLHTWDIDTDEHNFILVRSRACDDVLKEEATKWQYKLRFNDTVDD